MRLAPLCVLLAAARARDPRDVHATVVDTLFNRALKTSTPQGGDLGSTTLGKSGQLAAGQRTAGQLAASPHATLPLRGAVLPGHVPTLQASSPPKNVFGASWSCQQPFLPPPWGFPLRALPSDKVTVNTATATGEGTQELQCPFHRPQGPNPTADDKITPIPGPKGLPLDFFQNSYHVLKIPVYGIEEATLRWGNSFGPIVRYDNKNLGIKSWVFVNEPSLIEHVCGNKAANYQERYLPDVYGFATQEKGILGSKGAFNKKHRKMTQGPFLMKKYLVQFADGTTDIAKELVEVWRKSSESGVVEADFSEHMQRLTLDVIGKVAFTYDFGGMDKLRRELAGDLREDTEQDKLIKYVNTWTEQVGKLAAPWITWDVLELGTKMGDPRCSTLEGAIKGMRAIIFRIIDERRQQISDGVAPEDLMTELVRIQQESGKDSFTDEELWEDLHDVMGAGHETTANTLTTALFEISMHPEVGVKIQEELDAFYGTGPDRKVPTYEDWESGRLQYTTQVVKETLRLYPPIPLFVREAEKTDRLPGGYEIQGGDTVFMSAYALGRTERFWENPYKFDPDRFTPEKEAQRGKWTWLPFGAGPRMCLGSRFALMSTVLQLAVIMQSYSFSPVQPNYRTEKQSHIPYIGAWRGGMPFEYDMTITFPQGCNLKAVPRW